MASNKPKSKPSGTDSVSKKQSFQEWAAAGGGVPLQYKGREHVWDRKVKQYAEGGTVAANPDAADIIKRFDFQGMGGSGERGTMMGGRLGYAQPLDEQTMLRLGLMGHYAKGRGFENMGVDAGDIALQRQLDKDSSLKVSVGAGKGKGINRANISYNRQFDEGGSVDMAGGGIAKLVKGLKGPQDEALRLAQQRAALPPSKGGLGLPPDNTPEQRAAAMGFDFDNNYVHNTSLPFDKIKEGEKFSGIFTLPNYSANYGNVDMPLVARGKVASSSDLRSSIKNPSKQNKRAIDEELPSNIKDPADTADAYVEMQRRRNELARKLGYTGVKMNDEFGDTVSLVSPENIRSRFAAFDPFRKDVATAAAMGVAAPNLLAKEKKKAHGGDVHMAPGGAAFGTFPQMKPRRSKQDREAAKNVPVDLARGFVSGVLGAPGDIESLLRIPYDYFRSPTMSELVTNDKTSKTFFPTSEDIEKRLPFRSEAPVSRAASGAGQLAGGFYLGPGSPLRAVGALPGAIKHGAQEFAKASAAGAPRVIKPKGGNWIAGSVEKALAPLKSRTIAGETPAQRIPKHEALLSDPSLNKDQIDRVLYQLDETKKEAAIDQWVDRNLGNYVKKEMATPEDPVRKLAEEGITHLPADAMNRGQWLSESMEAIRRSEGFPGAGMARTEAGRGWENLADESIQITAPIVANKEMLAANPWLSKLDPNQSVYRARQADVSELGFDHIMDVLRQDVASGRIRPEQLSKVSMEQAVRRTYDYDQELAAKMNASRAAQREGLPVYKEYPEGYRWVELNKPGSFASESEAMGHSVRGYEPPKGHPDWMEASGDSGSLGYGHGGWEAIKEGKAKVYSLVDPKGAPHATVEVGPTHRDRGFFGNQRPIGDDYYSQQNKYIAGQNNGTVSPKVTFAEWWRASQGIPEPESLAPRITQIKGKQNAAPKEDYLPYIQDFVKGGNWSDVGDARNAGLRRYSDVFNLNEQRAIEASGQPVPNNEWLTGEDIQRLHNAVAPEGKRLKYDARGNIIGSDEGLAHGGPVKMAGGGAAFGIYPKQRATPSSEETKKAVKQASQVGVDLLLPQDAVDVGMMLVPGGKIARKAGAALIAGGASTDTEAGVMKEVLKKLLKPGADTAAQEVTAAERAAAGRKAAELIKSQPPVKASEALGQAMEKGFKKTTTTQADRTRVGGGNIGGAPFSAISEVDPAYAGKVWGVMDEGTAARLKNLTDPETAWTTMLGSANQLKTNPIVFDKLKKGFLESMKAGNLSPELEAKINQNLGVILGEGSVIRDPKMWRQVDTFEKRAAVADLMMGQGLPPKKGGSALGGEKSGKGVIFKPTDTLIRETEPYLLHPEHGGNAPTFAAGPRLFSMDPVSEFRPDLHPGFPTLISGKDLGYNMIPTPTEVYLPDWHKAFKQKKPERFQGPWAEDILQRRKDGGYKLKGAEGPGYYDLALGLEGEGLPSQALNDAYIRHLIREGFKAGGTVSGLSTVNKLCGCHD
jgi:hypothetical protein